MGQELTQVLCPECGASGDADPGRSRWQCTSCGSGYFLRRCSACARVSYVDGLQGIRLPWPCTWCGQFNAGFRQNEDPAAATAAELAAELTRYGPPPGAAGTAGQPDHGPVAGSGPPPGGEPGDHGQGTAAGTGNAGPAPPPRPTGPPPRPGGRGAWPVALVIAVSAAGAAAATVALTAGGPDAAEVSGARGAATRSVLFTASRVGSVIFQGVPGQLVITGTGPGPVTLTGRLWGDGGAPVAETRLDQATGVLAVSVRCGAAARCTQDLRLDVPGDAGVAVRQPGGQVVVTGLGGVLRVTAANADVSATGLRSAGLAAVITNGRLSAAFSTPPRQVSISLASAQATLRLPARTVYRFTREVTSGYVKVAIPQADRAARTVTARVVSGELEVLPS